MDRLAAEILKTARELVYGEGTVMGRSSIFGRTCGAGDDSGAGDVAPGATKARRASRPLLIFFRRKRSPEKRGPRCALFIAGSKEEMLAGFGSFSYVCVL